jgi:hypothetical protein
MRRVLSALALGAIVGAVVLAWADAPKDQYVVFDATAITIRDQRTHLEWQRFPEKGTLFDGGAGPPQQPRDLVFMTAYCNVGSGWRLPTVKELLTIIDEAPHRLYGDGGITYRWVDRNAFPDTLQAGYWTSSPGGSSQAWSVDFGTGLPSAVPVTTPLNARCVRTF